MMAFSIVVVIIGRCVQSIKLINASLGLYLDG